MPAAPDTKEFLGRYVTERLPSLQQGSFENPEDPPAFAVDSRYLPLQQLPYPV